jgi:hypothetical protein
MSMFYENGHIVYLAKQRLIAGSDCPHIDPENGHQLVSPPKFLQAGQLSPTLMAGRS